MGNTVTRQQHPLPPELLERVLELLPPRDLLAAVLVCRLWRRVGEQPHLWARLRLRLHASSPAVGWRDTAQ